MRSRNIVDFICRLADKSPVIRRALILFPVVFIFRKNVGLQNMYKLSQISEFCGATLQGNGDEERDWQLLTDSRTITDPVNSIFFALRTKFNDGHLYIPELIQKGVHSFVVDAAYPVPADTGNHFLVVPDVKRALQSLASKHRKSFELPIIGITGSNGKTIVKEWLLQLLSPFKHICYSPKSYNSQVGVPLSVWQLKKEHELGIFEAGISTINEMDNLEQIIRPEIGILTHLGTAHNEGFLNFEQKIDEKLKLFKHAKIVLMAYEPDIASRLHSKVLSFGTMQAEADLNILKKEARPSGTQITATYKGRDIEFYIPFTDEASIENACLCCLCALYLDCFNPQLFSKLLPVSMRLELKKGIHNCLIVNDSYSNDLHSLGAALSFLKQQSIHPKTTVILSDIEESGLDKQELATQIRRMLAEKQVSRLVAIGPSLGASQNILKDGIETVFFEDTDTFLAHFYTHRFQDETILVKGARKFHFERITSKLEQLSHGTVLEINLSAALHNLNTIKERLNPGVKVMAMVKAFAYGSGSYEMAKLVQDKVDYLAVAYSDEGVALRQHGIHVPIMVMNTDEDAFEQLSAFNLEPVVFSIPQLQAISSRMGLETLNIHIEIDTGMHRLGFKPEDVSALGDVIKNTPRLHVASIFSHFSGSDEKQFDDFTARQFDLFTKASAEIEKQLGYSTLKHISNTAATLRFRQDNLDMVRIGIGLYGIDPTGQYNELLEPVFTLKTTISQIKDIAANESVGYARKALSDHSRRIAILALGYADGLNRALSNGTGGFEINGQYAPIVGNVCMDMCMVDVSGLACAEGDEAILFGRDRPIQEVAKQLNTIPYEVLTSISQRVKRVYVSE